MPSPPRDRRAVLADPALRRSLGEMVRRRLPESEVEDVVQATLIEALASASAPIDPDELRRWVFGIARHKTADYHRKARRESPTSDPPEPEAEGEPHSARDMLRWAENELPAGETSKETLEWLLREGEGEKLEAIAKSEQLPAPRVRQRVVRLRKHFRDRWAAELAAVMAATLAIGLLFWLWKQRKPQEPPIARDVPSAEPDTTIPRARELRKVALEQCAAGAWDECVAGLDRARALDPGGDTADDVVQARKAAADARTSPAPLPSAVPAPKVKAPVTTTPITTTPGPSAPFAPAPVPTGGGNGSAPKTGKPVMKSPGASLDDGGSSKDGPLPGKVTGGAAKKK